MPGFLHSLNVPVQVRAARGASPCNRRLEPDAMLRRARWRVRPSLSRCAAEPEPGDRPGSGKLLKNSRQLLRNGDHGVVPRRKIVELPACVFLDDFGELVKRSAGGICAGDKGAR